MVETEAFSARLAEVLEELASERGLSQNALAKKSGVSQSQISRLFGARRDARVDQLILIAEALGTTTSALLAEAEARLAAATEPTPTEEVAKVHTLPMHGRDIPPIPEGLAARKVPLEKRRGYLAKHQWDSIGEEPQLPPEEWDD